MQLPERLKQLDYSKYIKAGIFAIAYRLQGHTASFEIAQEGESIVSNWRPLSPHLVISFEPILSKYADPKN
jgi:hypothetical protein